MVEGTNVGFIHPVGDIHGYAESLVQLLTDPALRCEMGGRARERMRGQYNWRTVAEKIVTAMSRQTALRHR